MSIIGVFPFLTVLFFCQVDPLNGRQLAHLSELDTAAAYAKLAA
jgi:hypothetical protein